MPNERPRYVCKEHGLDYCATCQIYGVWPAEPAVPAPCQAQPTYLPRPGHDVNCSSHLVLASGKRDICNCNDYREPAPSMSTTPKANIQSDVFQSLIALVTVLERGIDPLATLAEAQHVVREVLAGRLDLETNTPFPRTSLPAQPWISVKERLPENPTEKVWCAFITHMGTQKHTGVLKYHSGHFWGADAITREVTHWMPLPEPPVSGDKEKL